jgi:hypothetical protein
MARLLLRFTNISRRPERRAGARTTGAGGGAVLSIPLGHLARLLLRITPCKSRVGEAADKAHSRPASSAARAFRSAKKKRREAGEVASRRAGANTGKLFAAEGLQSKPCAKQIIVFKTVSYLPSEGSPELTGIVTLGL